jgi:leader peptidase (prepilin peptidase) / N-methyltransferase
MDEHLSQGLRIVYAAVAGLFGLVFGSFLNVCIFRLPRDLSIVAPRSFCPHCSETVRWFDNIPVLSYVALRGQCRHCSHSIALRYPAVEITAAILITVVFWKYSLTPLFLKWAIFELLLLALFWTDLEERILPDELTLGGAAAGLLLSLMVPASPGLLEFLIPSGTSFLFSPLNALLSGLCLAFPVWLLGAVYLRLRGREGLGFGDVKLLAMFGVFLGLSNGLLALLIGSIGGSLFGLLYIRFSGQDPGSYELPFGSFLCVGAALVPLFAGL